MQMRFFILTILAILISLTPVQAEEVPQNGIHKTFYENGKTILKEDGTIISETTYVEEGHNWKQIYKDGKVVESNSYDKDGNIIFGTNNQKIKVSELNQDDPQISDSFKARIKKSNKETELFKARLTRLNLSEEDEKLMYYTISQVLVNLAIGLALYDLDAGDYPTTTQGLIALRGQPITEPIPKQWNGPYIKNEPIDPWGRLYGYRFPGLNNKESFDLFSYGPDGVASEDDVFNWSEEAGAIDMTRFSNSKEKLEVLTKTFPDETSLVSINEIPAFLSQIEALADELQVNLSDLKTSPRKPEVYATLSCSFVDNIRFLHRIQSYPYNAVIKEILFDKPSRRNVSEIKARMVLSQIKPNGEEESVQAQGNPPFAVFKDILESKDIFLAPWEKSAETTKESKLQNIDPDQETVVLLSENSVKQVFLPGLIAHLYRLTPKNVSFRLILFKNGRELEFQGYATSGSLVNEFKENLIGSEYFSEVEVKFNTPRRIFNNQVFDFRISSTIKL